MTEAQKNRLIDLLLSLGKNYNESEKAEMKKYVAAEDMEEFEKLVRLYGYERRLEKEAEKYNEDFEYDGWNEDFFYDEEEDGGDWPESDLDNPFDPKNWDIDK